MTGEELIEALRALTPEQLKLEVITEGCDCDGDVSKVEIRPGYTFRTGEHPTEIYLRRDDDPFKPPRYKKA